jgi:hypothetical protein
MPIELDTLLKAGDGTECILDIIGKAPEGLYDARKFHDFLTSGFFELLMRIYFRDGETEGVRQRYVRLLNLPPK